jgi:hypothetical protein
MDDRRQKFHTSENVFTIVSDKVGKRPALQSSSRKITLFSRRVTMDFFGCIVLVPMPKGILATEKWSSSMLATGCVL